VHTHGGFDTFLTQAMLSLDERNIIPETIQTSIHNVALERYSSFCLLGGRRHLGMVIRSIVLLHGKQLVSALVVLVLHDGIADDGIVESEQCTRSEADFSCCICHVTHAQSTRPL
jgi:hypothetical protein